jgi:hypothetical protein
MKLELYGTSNASIYGKHSGRAETRKILRDVWTTQNNTPSITPFRLVYNAGTQSSGNHKYVYDSSAYTRFSKEKSMARFIK